MNPTIIDSRALDVGDVILNFGDTIYATGPAVRMRERAGEGTATVRTADEAMRGVITFSLPRDFTPCEPGLVKIVYQLAYWILGSPFLEEPRARTIRAFLRSPGSDIELSGICAEFLGGSQMRNLSGAREEHLIGGLMRQHGHTVGYARIFNRLDAMILLAEHSYPQIDEAGVAVVMNVASKHEPPVFTTFRSLGWVGLRESSQSISAKDPRRTK